MCHFSLATIKMSSLLVMARNLNTMCLSMVFLKFILFEVCWVSWSINLRISPNLKNFSHYFFKYCFCPILFLLSFWDSNYINVNTFLFLSHRSLRLCTFFFLLNILNLFSFLSLERKCLLICLQVHWYLLLLLLTDVKSTQWIFISNVAFFQY